MPSLEDQIFGDKWEGQAFILPNDFTLANLVGTFKERTNLKRNLTTLEKLRETFKKIDENKLFVSGVKWGKDS